MDLVEFLRARLDEDEAPAKRIEDMYGTFANRWLLDDAHDVTAMDGGEIARTALAAYSEHIARHDPARVLAEVEAKRRIVDVHEGLHSCGASDYDDADPCPTLRLLALPYADHEDYRPEWKP